MCGIAGYSLSPDSAVERTLAAQALLAGIAERGADAAGYAFRSPGGEVVVHKQRSGASRLLDRVEIATDATEVLLHVRDYTKGHPEIEANNHPIRHGPVVGVHNGIIFNDDEVLASYGLRRAREDMTVDSEAIFALAGHKDGRAEVLEELRGSMATAWLDERRDGVLFCARGTGRPLWVGEGEGATFFASTQHALELVESYARVPLSMRELAEGTLAGLSHGRVSWYEHFTPNDEFEERQLPAVRAPQERRHCLRLLAALATAA
jgi:glucosamine 6-phosphate synthetase-like amidotransferase/phosphosugar isomerase protein